jgi:hypothetical protein
MSMKAQIKTPAKTPVATAAAHIPQPPVAELAHEAERPGIAAQLEGAARLGHSLGAVGVDSSAPPIIQRQEIPEEEEEERQLIREPDAIQRQELPEEEEELMMKRDDHRVGPQGGPVRPEVEAAIRRARGGGQPLEGALQEQMSASLGHDFSGVRVHTDLEADQLNQQLSAKAFTTGSDIFFRQGAYDPSSGGGRELIAHELSHVVQQKTGRASEGGGGMTVRPVGDAFEQDAGAIAREVARTGLVAECEAERIQPRANFELRGEGREDVGLVAHGRPAGPGVQEVARTQVGLTEMGGRGSELAYGGGTPRGRGKKAGGWSGLRGSGGGRGTTAVIHRRVEEDALRPAELAKRVAGSYRVTRPVGAQGVISDYSKMLLRRIGTVLKMDLHCSQAVGMAKGREEEVEKTEHGMSVRHSRIWQAAGGWGFGGFGGPFPDEAVARTPVGTEISFWKGEECKHIGVHGGRGLVAGYNQSGYVVGGRGAGYYSLGYPVRDYEIRAEPGR